MSAAQTRVVHVTADDVSSSARLAALLHNCEDCARSMTHCAAQAERMALQLLLTQRAATWHRWAGELSALRSDSGTASPSPPAHASNANDFLASGESDAALLTASEQCEAQALRMVRETLEQDIPRILRAVLLRHVEGIHDSRAQMRRLENDSPLAHV